MRYHYATWYVCYIWSHEIEIVKNFVSSVQRIEILHRHHKNQLLAWKKRPLVTHQLFSLSQLKIQDVRINASRMIPPPPICRWKKIDRLYFFIRLTPSPPLALFQKAHFSQTSLMNVLMLDHIKVKFSHRSLLHQF